MLAGVLCLGACCGGRHAVEPTPIVIGHPDGGESEPASSEEAASRLIKWSLGARRETPLRGPVRVLWREAAQPLDRAREVSVCGPEADSIMPISEENTVLVTAGGVLYTVRADGKNAAFEKTTFAPDESIDYLLARKRGARPASVLALVTNKESGRPSFWNLRVDQGEVTGHKVTRMADFVSLPRYFEAYDAPRCKSSGKDCLIVDRSGQTTSVLHESERGAMPRTEDEDLSGRGVRDVVWGVGGGQWLLGGAGCPRPAEKPTGDSPTP